MIPQSRSLILCFTLAICATSCTSDTSVDGEAAVVSNLQRAVSESRPVESQDELGRLLGIPAERRAAITIGPEAKNLLAQRLSPGRLDYICIGGACICAGDPDCNDMFSGICRNPTTNGSCTTDIGGTVICYCTP